MKCAQPISYSRKLWDLAHSSIFMYANTINKGWNTSPFYSARYIVVNVNVPARMHAQLPKLLN